MTLRVVGLCRAKLASLIELAFQFQLLLLLGEILGCKLEKFLVANRVLRDTFRAHIGFLEMQPDGLD